MQKEQAIQAGIKLARENGLINISRSQISSALGIQDGSWSHVVGVPFSALVADIKERIGDEKYLPATKKRVSPALRKENILHCAVTLAEKVGYSKVTATAVAEEAGVSHGTVLHHFGTMLQLKNDIMRHAIKSSNHVIIAQGLVAKDKRAMKVSQEVKEIALKCLI